MDVRLPDGTIIRNVPDGTTKEQLTAKLKANGYSFDEPSPSAAQNEVTPDWAKTALRLASPAGLVSALASEEGRADLGNFAAGGVRGAGSIGATIVAPLEGMQANRQRRAVMDESLRQMGADTGSLAFQTGKLGAEVGGTMGAGGAIANILSRAAPGALPALVNAIRSGGMTTATRVAPGFAPKAADMATRIAGGAIGGGASAALVNPDDAEIGAVIGGAAPMVAKVAGAAGKIVGNAVSPRMARNNATNKLAEVLGDDSAQTIADIQTNLIRGAEGIPLSAAAVTKSPKLAQLEQGSRMTAGPVWYDFDQRQGKAVFDNVMGATREADELGKRLSERQENWKAAWDKAAENQKPRLWQKRMTQFGADLETALRSPESSNPAVRGVLEAINAEFDRVGPSFSIGNLQQLRANLNGKVQPNSPDVFKSAPRDNPAIRSLIKEMDDILNTSTGGKWQKVIEGYAKDSERVHASKAASKVRGSFVDADTGRVRGTSADPDGDVAKITEAGLGGAMDAARLPDKSLALSPEAQQKLEATLEALRRQNVVQKLKKTSTAGGGSDSIPNAIAVGAAQKAGAPNMLLQLIDATKRIGTAKTDNALARLLSSPDELARALELLGQPKAPSALALGLYRSLPATAADR